MKEVAVSDIIKKVRITIDENGTETAYLNGVPENMELNEIIRSKILDAVRIVEMAAPAHLLGSGDTFAESIGWVNKKGLGDGYIPLPDDFMRLVSFQMSDWSYPVTGTQILSDEDSLYALLKSDYRGSFGTPKKPAAAIVKYPIGLVLEFFSSNDGGNAAVKRARYIPIPKFSTDESTVSICEKCEQSIIYYCAYLTLLSRGDSQNAAGFLAQSNELLK